MKKIIALSLLLSLSSLSYAGGGIVHMYVASEAAKSLPKELQEVINQNRDAYLVGAYYPDSGYIQNNQYGEISHWDPFIYAFANYLKEIYSDPVKQNPKLVAFLFGCASHRVSDEIIHWTFYPELANKDFKGNGEEAHKVGDVGIDLLLAVDKKSAVVDPKTWWVPVEDLRQVYYRMGQNIPVSQIVDGNGILSMANTGEEVIAPASYPFLKFQMPWGSHNYMETPLGGINMDIEKVSQYQMKLWEVLNNRDSQPVPSHMTTAKSSEPNLSYLKGLKKAATAKRLQDGSVEFVK